jgi:glyoxylase-like metal-dependent hydrolase (beta-lactamase superfamily II)
LRRITQRVSYLPADDTTDRPNLVVVAGSDASLVVDAGNSAAHASLLLQAISQQASPPLRYVVLTHWHWDHVFGLASLDVPAFAHVETRRQVAHQAALDWSDSALDQRVADGTEAAFCRDMIKLELPCRAGLVIRPPEVTYRDGLEVHLGGVTVKVVHVGGDHGADSSVVYVPEERALILGDCLGADLYGGPPAYTQAELFPLLDKLSAFEAEWYLSGHGRPNSRDALQDYVQPLRVVGELVARYGRDRERIAVGFEQQIGRPMNDDDWWDAGAFMAGLERQGR